MPRALTDSERIDAIFMHCALTDTQSLLERAQLIVKMRNIQNGTQPAKRKYERKAKPEEKGVDA